MPNHLPRWSSAAAAGSIVVVATLILTGLMGPLLSSTGRDHPIAVAPAPSDSKVRPLEQGPPTIQPNVVFLTNATSSLIVASNPSVHVVGQLQTKSVYLFLSNATQIAALLPNQIAVSQLGYGFAIWVTSVKQTGPGACLASSQQSGFCLQGNQTALGNIFRNGALSTSLSPPTVKYGLGNTFWSGSADVAVTGSASIIPTFKDALNFSLSGMSSAWFLAGFTITATATVAISGSIGIGASYQLVKPYAVWCFPVSVVVVCVNLESSLEVSVTASSAYTFTESFTLSDFVGMSDNGGVWTPHYHESHSATYSQKLSQSLSAQINVDTPRVDFYVDDAAGPFVDVQPGLQFSVTRSGQTTTWSLDALLNLAAGVAVNSELGVTAEVSWNLLTISWTLFSGSWTQQLQASTTQSNPSSGPISETSSTAYLWFSSFTLSGTIDFERNTYAGTNGATQQTTYTMGSTGSSGPVSSPTLSAGDYWYAGYDPTTGYWSNWVEIIVYSSTVGSLKASFTTSSPSTGPLAGDEVQQMYFWASSFTASSTVDLLVNTVGGFGGTCTDLNQNGCVGGASIWTSWSMNSNGQGASYFQEGGLPGGTFYAAGFDSSSVLSNWVEITLAAPSLQAGFSSTSLSGGPITGNQVQEMYFNPSVFTGNKGAELLVSTGASIYSGLCQDLNGNGCVGSASIWDSWSMQSTGTGLSPFGEGGLPGGTNYFAGYDMATSLISNWIEVSLNTPSLQASFSTTSSSNGPITGSHSSTLYFWVSSFTGSKGVELLINTAAGTGGTCQNYNGNGCVYGASIWDNWLTQSNGAGLSYWGEGGFSSGTYYFACYDDTTGLISNWVGVYFT